MDTTLQIREGKTSLGIEFGSTRIKAVVIDETCKPIATGAYDWENRLENGNWTYALADIRTGLQSCYAKLCANLQKNFGIVPQRFASIGISAMMHGYLAFGNSGELLTPFRTWRNTTTEQASRELTQAFAFHIPQRWSIAHLYQAILNGEEHLSRLEFLTTLAGYVHWQLTGEKVLGIGDASGMFPIGETGNYHPKMLEIFAEMIKTRAYPWQLPNVLPKIIPAGETAGTLTEQGAKLLDPTGTLQAGIPFCPPEGDAQTGMVATNTIAPRTGNVSAGTSIFAMAVLEHSLAAVHEEIDLVTTPCGSPVAMVHCNNCTTDLDAWVKLFGGFLKTLGVEISKPVLYDKLYEAALSGAENGGGLLSYNYYSGEHITGITQGRPMLVRAPESDFTVQNLMRTLVYSCLATLKIGMDILLKEENVQLDTILAHGGLFKSPITGQSFLAAALETPVMLMDSAGEGGAWGIALLAAYQARNNKAKTLTEFLNTRVFAQITGTTLSPLQKDVDGFRAFMVQYQDGLSVEKHASVLNLR